MSSNQWSELHFRGAHAWEYLQGQLTQEVGPETANGSWTALLQPDSTVVSVVILSSVEDSPVLALPSGLVDATVERLARFRLRSEVEWHVQRVDNPFSDEAGRIQAGFPGVVECQRNVTPHSFGARFIEKSVSFTKGCFTGQELVGRLDSRGGNVPWRLVVWRGSSQETADEWFRSVGPEGPSGVTSWDEASGWGMGLIHRGFSLTGSLPDGITLCELVQ